MTTKINKIYSKPIISSTTYIYLSGTITNAENFIEEIQAIKEAEVGDSVEIFINSGGGYVHTAVQLCNAIASCKGVVTGHIEGICHSAATYVFLSCDEWKVNENCMMMIHNYTGGAYGKGEELKADVLGTDKWIAGIMKDIYTNFITKKELKKVINGKDMYLTSEEILKRLPKVMEARILAEQKEQDKAFKLAKQQVQQAFTEEEEENERSNNQGVSKSTPK